MAHLTIQSGSQGQEHTLVVDWFDHNNVRYKTEIVMRIEDQDKPRTLSVLIDNKLVFQRKPTGITLPMNLKLILCAFGRHRWVIVGLDYAKRHVLLALPNQAACVGDGR